MAQVLLALNAARLENDQAPHQVAAYYFNEDATDIQAFTDDFATFEAAMLGISYSDAREGKTNHPAGYMKADEWLHDKVSTTKTHILITDGAPHSAASACKNEKSFESDEDGEKFTNVNALPCLEACAVNNDCDATICAANKEPFDKTRDCGGDKGERGKGEDCVCAIHVAGRFNAKAHYSTTIVGVPNYQHPTERYTEIFNALGTSKQHYLDAEACFEDADCLDDYVEQTLLATCRTPYHKCMRVPDGSLGTPWSRCQQDSCIATTPNCNLMGGQLWSEANNRNYCGEPCRCDSELHFQTKSWYHGCLTAEGSDDHAACVAACNAPWGCCVGSSHGDDYEYQCQSNSCGGGGCCMASAGICHRACDYSYSAWLEDPTIPVFPTPGHE